MAKDVVPESLETARSIVHLDLDAFYAAVEILEDPSLREHPLVVGGRPEERGVVSTASYPARKLGIHSAMPTRQALELCPDLIVLPPRHKVYGDYSRQVMALVRKAAPLVEQISVDEAFMDLTSVVSTWEDAVDHARDLQVRVQEQVGLSASLGVAANKLVAKVASDRDKPAGLTVVRPGEDAAFLAPLPVRVLWGIGPVTAERLDRELQIVTVGDLAQANPVELRTRFGKQGARMLRHALGQDRRPVTSEHEVKSISQERTFARDIDHLETLKGSLWRMSQRVAERLVRSELAAGTVSIKMRYADFSTLTRQMRLMVPTDDAVEVYRAALTLFERAWEQGRPVRLLGVGGSQLEPPSGQLPLWETDGRI